MRVRGVFIVLLFALFLLPVVTSSPLTNFFDNWFLEGEDLLSGLVTVDIDPLDEICPNNDGDGFSTCDGDCNDHDPNVYPGNAEVCDDGIDNNCNGAVDERCSLPPTQKRPTIRGTSNAPNPGITPQSPFGGGSPRMASAAATFALTVQNDFNYPATQHVQTGVPFVFADGVFDEQNVRLLDGGVEIPLQTRVMSRHYGELTDTSKPIQWLLFMFPITLGPNQVKTLTVDYGPNVVRGAVPIPIVVSNNANNVVIDTNKAVFTISKQSFSIFEQILIDKNGNGQVTDPLLRNPGFIRIDRRPNQEYIRERRTPRSPPTTPDIVTTTNVVPQVTVIEQGPGVTRVKVTGDVYADLEVDVNDNYCGSSEMPSNTCFPRACQSVYTCSPLCTGACREQLRYLTVELIYTFYADSDEVELVHHIINKDRLRTWGEEGGGPPFTGATNKYIYSELEGWDLVIPTTLNPSTAHMFGKDQTIYPNLWDPGSTNGYGGAAEGQEIITVPSFTNTVELYQDSSGHHEWDNGQNAALTNFGTPWWEVDFRGYKTLVDGVTTTTGHHALGGLTVEDGNAQLSASVDNFWQKFPSGLKFVRFAGAGDYVIELMPTLWRSFYQIEGSKRHNDKIFLKFSSTVQPSQTLRDRMHGFAYPTLARAPVEQYQKSFGLGFIGETDYNKFHYFERYLEDIFEGTFGPQTIWENLAEKNHFGVLTYGNTPRGAGNPGYIEITYTHDDRETSSVIATNYVKRGDRKMYDWGVDAVAHLADRVFKWTKRGSTFRENNKMAKHDEGSRSSLGRREATLSHDFGKGLVFFHLITGNEDLKEPLDNYFLGLKDLESEGYGCNGYSTNCRPGSSWPGEFKRMSEEQRQTAMPLRIVNTMYLMTGDPKWLRMGKRIVEGTWRQRLAPVSSSYHWHGFVADVQDFPNTGTTHHVQTWQNALLAEEVGILLFNAEMAGQPMPQEYYDALFHQLDVIWKGWFLKEGDYIGYYPRPTLGILEEQGHYQNKGAFNYHVFPTDAFWYGFLLSGDPVARRNLVETGDPIYLQNLFDNGNGNPEYLEAVMRLGKVEYSGRNQMDVTGMGNYLWFGSGGSRHREVGIHSQPGEPRRWLISVLPTLGICPDVDGDGFSPAGSHPICGPPDCNDGPNPAGCPMIPADCNLGKHFDPVNAQARSCPICINPHATEFIGDTIDQSCSGAAAPSTCTDNDGDGFYVGPAHIGFLPSGSTLGIGQCTTTAPAPAAYVGKPGWDCNDNRQDINPAVTEPAGSTEDLNCDGFLEPPTSACVDNDGDGFYAYATGGYLECGLRDPDDTPGTGHLFNPRTREVCDNGVDDNGDGDTDCQSAICDFHPNCRVAPCGNGRLDPGEQCDFTSGGQVTAIPECTNAPQGFTCNAATCACDVKILYSVVPPKVPAQTPGDQIIITGDNINSLTSFVVGGREIPASQIQIMPPRSMDVTLLLADKQAIGGPGNYQAYIQERGTGNLQSVSLPFGINRPPVAQLIAPTANQRLPALPTIPFSIRGQDPDNDPLALAVFLREGGNIRSGNRDRVYTEQNIPVNTRRDVLIPAPYINKEDPSLQLYLSFNDVSTTLYDQSINQHQGVTAGSTPYSIQQGVIGGAFHFTGQNTKGTIPNHPSLNFGQGQSFALSFWIKSTDTNGLQFIVNKRANNVGYFVAYIPATPSNPALLRFSLDEGPTSIQANHQGNIFDGQWHHVVAMRNPTAVALWVDGQQTARTPSTSLGGLMNNEDLCISNECVTTGGFNGDLDELAVYNRALSPQEIALHARALQNPPSFANGRYSTFLLADDGTEQSQSPTIQFTVGTGGGNNPPIITQLTPRVFPENQLTQLTITGANFETNPQTQVLFGAFVIPQALVTIVSSAQLTAQVLPQTLGIPAGLHNILLANPSSGLFSSPPETVLVSECQQGQQQQCNTGLLGVCAAGLQDCVNGLFGPCVQQQQSRPENTVPVCRDGLDNDCDGLIDCFDGSCPDSIRKYPCPIS